MFVDDFLMIEPSGLALVLAGAALVVSLVGALHYTLERRILTERIKKLEQTLQETSAADLPASAVPEMEEESTGDQAPDALPPGIRFV